MGRVFEVLHGIVAEPIIKSLTALPAEGEGLGNIVAPPIGFDQILELTHSNAFHQTCLSIKADMTVGDDYDAPEAVCRFLEGASGDIPFLELLHRVVCDWETLGNGYLEIARDRSGRIAELGHVHGQTIYHLQQGRELGGYVQELDSRTEFAPFGTADGRNELLHFRRYTPLSSFYGAPSWVAALEALRLDQQKKIFYSAFFANFAVPSMAVVLEGAEFDENTEKKLREGLLQTRGVENAHRTLLLSIPFENAKVHFEKLALDLKDMPFDKLSQATREEILAAHAVPPRLVGIVTAGSLGGQSEAEGQMNIFINSGIMPRRAFVERRVKRLLRDVGLPEEFALKGLLPVEGTVADDRAEDEAARQTALKILKSMETEWARW